MKKIYINLENVAGSSLIEKKSFLENRKKYDKIENIKVVNLDNFLRKEKKIDFIKIDVEGFEFQVLKGIKNILKIKKPKMVIEFSSYIYEKEYRGLSKQIINFLFGFYKYIEIIENKKIYKSARPLLKDALGKQLNFFCYN